MLLPCVLQVGSQWQELLCSIVAAYQEATSRFPGLRLIGVYLRGSLPRGLFMHGVSDVDSFALVTYAGDGELQQAQQDLDAGMHHIAGQNQHLGFTKVGECVLGCADIACLGL